MRSLIKGDEAGGGRRSLEKGEEPREADGGR